MKRWGLPSERPESYWQPLHGQCGLTPAGLGDVTPAQMDACWDWVESKVAI